ncbi:hypothetical protein GCM10023086_75510 [Streptomyces venetus]|uniref:NADPH-dependent FMN reductase-like domain-containing protein n=1 Tax=Streptomyces venetus TaxID=1701086 RepID=A0ABP8HJC9_9ACTN
MARVLSVSGSPSASSRTNRLLRHLDDRIVAQDDELTPLDVRTIPAQALLRRRLPAPRHRGGHRTVRPRGRRLHRH